MSKQPNLTRRTFLRTAAGAAAGGMLAACGAAPSTTTSDGRERITLSMWTHDTLYVKFFTLRGEEWKKNHPQYDITFNFQQVPEVFTKVLANLAARIEVPDLLGLEQGAFPQFMRDDVIDAKFLDLTPRIGADRSKFVEGSWTKFINNGKIYGVDSGLSASVLYWQPALLEKVGATAPPEFWEDLPAMGTELAKQGTAFIAFQAEGNDSFTQLFWQRGGRYFDENNAFVLNSPENRQMAVEVLTFIKQGIDSGFIRLFTNADFWAPSIYAAYQDGSVNGIIMPDWYSDAQLKASAPDMAGRWQIAPMPKWKGGGLTTSVWGGTGFAVFRDSPRADLAWDLLKFTYMTKESQIQRYETLKYFPTMFEALEDPRVVNVTDDYYKGQEVGKIFEKIAPDVPQWYQSPARAPLITALNASLNRFYGGQITAEQTVDTIVADTEEVMKYL